LSLATQLLDADLFVSVEEGDRRRRAGWRAGHTSCEGCGVRVWGAGVGGGVWEKWLEREEERRRRGKRKKGDLESGVKVDVIPRRDIKADRAGGKGKKREAAGADEDVDGAGTNDETKEASQLLIFRCGHVWHRRCLAELQANDSQEQGENRLQCVVCR
jgi:hypothetical protein